MMEGFMIICLVMAAFGAGTSLATKRYTLFAICTAGPIVAIIQAFI